MHSFARKSPALFIALAVVLTLGAGVAYAFWTSGGSGTGTASTGDTTTSVTVVQTSDVSDLRPGGAPQELSGTFNNPAVNGPVYVTAVTVSIGSVAKATDAVAGVCDATDYTLTNPVMTVNATVPTGADQGAWGVPADVATIQFNDKPTTNQDPCKGATVILTYVSS
jgi:hypothetical protein